MIEARRCLNCFGLGHFARNCGFASKCSKCGPICHLKHATVLHDLYGRSSSVDFKATNTKESVNACDFPSSSEENKHVVARKICPSNKIVLLRTCAVKVINPRTGRFTLGYAQHDTASQGTIVSKSLMEEFGLVASKSSEIHIRTLANEFTPCRGVVNFELESLTTGERFDVENALVVPELVDDDCVLPHSVDTSGLEHFDGVNIPTLSYKRCIDILIGQTDKFLLTVLEEREEIRPEDPKYVLTRLGPIASGGCVDGRKCSERKLQTLKVNLECCNKNDCVKLRQEVSALREQLRRYILEDEKIQVSTSDEITRELVEPNVNVVNNRYEIPVPLKVDVVEALPNNYAYTLDRNFLLRKSALKNNCVKKTVIETFYKIISNEWLVPVDSNPSRKPCWYLPFFVTKQAKSRVVFNGAATYKGVSLNDAVYPGENLLNGLVDVLTRFRLGKFACMEDVSKCFFQVSISESQRDLFRLIWFKDNDLVNGFTQIYRFTRHVWGVNSSPYIALLAIKRLVSENVTNPSPSTLSAILQCRYMDDLLLSSDSLVELKTIARESRLLFENRRFTLRKWISNNAAKSILSDVPPSDRTSNLKEIDLASQPMPDLKALGLKWKVEEDTLCICPDRKLTEVSTRRQMLSAIAGQFDPLGIRGPWLLTGKLILQRVTASGIDWDEKLPDEIVGEWKSWITHLERLDRVSIPRCCFDKVGEAGVDKIACYQLHGFCDASNVTIAVVVYVFETCDW